MAKDVPAMGKKPNIKSPVQVLPGSKGGKRAKRKVNSRRSYR